MRALFLMISLAMSSTLLAMSDKPPTPQKNNVADSPATDYEAYREKLRKSLDRSCQSDADCQPTCMFGAVNKGWLEKRKDTFQDCFDGCMGWGQTYACVENVCTTFRGGSKKKTKDKACNG